MQSTLCICALRPQLATRTRLALIVHAREARKPTNTGQLAAQCLPRSTIELVGDQEHRAALAPIGPDEQPLLLYPADDAVALSAYADHPRPIVLIVPDGSWRQAHKMRRRVPGLAEIPCVALPEAGPSEYRLRAEHHVGGLATFEAIARALRILEGEAGVTVEAALMRLFRIMVDRTLWLRGRLSDRDVTGGLPDAAREQNPRSTPANRR
jgi:DTW domain-containing protein